MEKEDDDGLVFHNHLIIHLFTFLNDCKWRCLPSDPQSTTSKTKASQVTFAVLQTSQAFMI